MPLPVVRRPRVRNSAEIDPGIEPYPLLRSLWTFAVLPARCDPSSQTCFLIQFSNNMTGIDWLAFVVKGILDPGVKILDQVRRGHNRPAAPVQGVREPCRPFEQLGFVITGEYLVLHEGDVIEVEVEEKA